MNTNETNTKEKKQVVVIISPLYDQDEIATHRTKNPILYLKNIDVFNLNEDPTNKFDLNPIIDKEIESIIINLSLLERHMSKVDQIKELLYAIRTNKDLKDNRIVFVGAKSLIMYCFGIKGNREFYDCIDGAIASLN